MQRMTSLLALTVVTLLGTTAELAAKTDFNVVGREMAGVLQNRHYARHNFDAELSGKMLDQYLADLDPARLLFTAADVAVFRQDYGRRLHELLLKSRSMEPAREIYARYQQRIIDRDRYVRALLKDAKFTFRSLHSILGSREDAAWPANEEQARILWKKHLEDELLSEVMRRELRARFAGGQPGEGKQGEPGVEEKVVRGYERIRRNAAATDDEEIAEVFFSAIASTYDPHTDYLSKRENDRFQIRMRKGLVGIGVTLRPEDDGSVGIAAIVIDGPADKAGDLQLNDRIVGVDPANKGAETNMIDVLYMKTDRIVENIKGAKGTKVRLRVRPAEAAPGVFKDIVIVRGQVEYKDQLARAELILSKDAKLGEPRVGFLQIPSFYYDFEDGIPSVARDVESLLRRLQTERIDGLVIDLRGNGGGALHEVIRMAGFFLGAKPVVQVRDAGRVVKTKYARLGRPLYTGPLVILTDKASASASEILAGVLQDYNRAVVVGDSSTYGKGTVQQQIEIGRFFPVFADPRRAGVLKPTIQKYYRVSGSSVQLVGVRPDIVLPSRYDAYEFGEAFQPHALKHDTIAKSRKFAPLDAKQLYLESLKGRSAKRVASSLDYKYLLEDVARIKDEREENRISLNREERVADLDARQVRRKTRNDERRVRFAKTEERDGEQFRLFELTLDKVKAEELREIGPDNERTIYTRRVTEALDGANEAPKWPSGIGPAKRESIAIAMDLIELTQASRVARKTPKA